MLTRKDFLKNIGHFCTMVDGSKGFICKTISESKKTILDMTVKELLEKLDEIIKCQFRCKDCKG